MSALIIDRAKVVTATLGTGTVTLGLEVSPFQTWANAGASGTTKRYSYLIEEGTDWEIGEGIYDSGALTLTRVLQASSTGALLNLAGNATVACVRKAADDRFDVIYANAAIANPTASIDIDVTDYDEIEVVGRAVTLAATGFRGVFLSTDGGATWPRTTGDYIALNQVGTDVATFIGGNHETSSNLARNFGANIKGLRTNGTAKWMNHIVSQGGNRIFVNSLAPITHIRLGAIAASAGAFINMTGGNVTVIGRR